MRSERKISLLISIFILTLGIFFVFPAESARADTLIFHEGCASDPSANLDVSTDIIVGNSWSSKIILDGAPASTIRSSVIVRCQPIADDGNEGYGYTMDPSPTATEYYVDYNWYDEGTVGNGDTIGVLLNYTTDNYYACFTEDDTTPDVILYKVSGGTGSVLTEVGNQTIDSGDQLECRIDYNGGLNPTISLTNVTDTAELATWTDSSSPLTETPGAGVFCGGLPNDKTNDDCENALRIDEIQLYEVPGPPIVTTNAATGVTVSEATLNGNITSTGGDNATVRGFAYGTTSTLYTTIATTSESGSFGTGTFSEQIKTLQSGVTYYFRAYATNPNGTGYGLPILNFTAGTDTVATRILRLFEGFTIKLVDNRIILYGQ